MTPSRTILVALASLLVAPVARAQQSSYFLPPSATLTNYDRVLIGQEEALESGAFVARVGDSTAGWYNPAGLALVRRSVIGASATGYELDIVDMGQIKTTAGKTTLSQLPSYFGAVLGGDVLPTDRWRLGFSSTKPTSWTASVNGATIAGAEVNYSSRVSISTLVPTLSASYAALPSLRFGAGFGVAITSISQTQVLAERFANAGGSTDALRAADWSGAIWGGQGTFGVQWDVTDHLVAGASLRTPTFTILRTAGISVQSIETATPTTGGLTSSQVYFVDPDVAFTYKLPLTVNFGLAWREPRFDVEADVRYHSAIDPYEMLSSTGSMTQVTIASDGTRTTKAVPFPGLTYGSIQVWNLALGGRYQLDEAWSLHGGFYTDMAPADPAVSSRTFRSVNLYGITAGAKLKGEHLSGSLGLGFCWGNSDNFEISDGLGTPVSTRLSIVSISLLYAIAYRF